MKEKFRIVLLSCAGAPFSAEVLNNLQRIQPDIIDQIAAVVLSKPKISYISELPLFLKLIYVFKKKGSKGLILETKKAVHYRFNKLVSSAERAIRKGLIKRNNGLSFYRKIEDFCDTQKIPIYTTRDVNDDETINYLRSLQPDLIIIATFHHILEPTVIEIAKVGTLNIHCSILPKYRGSDPINSALKNGDTEIGVTIYWVDEGIDTGDIFSQKAFLIPPRASETTLRPMLAADAADMLVQCLKQLRNGILLRRPQLSR